MTHFPSVVVYRPRGDLADQNKLGEHIHSVTKYVQKNLEFFRIHSVSLSYPTFLLSIVVIKLVCEHNTPLSNFKYVYSFIICIHTIISIWHAANNIITTCMLNGQYVKPVIKWGTRTESLHITQFKKKSPMLPEVAEKVVMK